MFFVNTFCVAERGFDRRGPQVDRRMTLLKKSPNVGSTDVDLNLIDVWIF